MEIIWGTLKQTLMITAFVLFMMIVIEYINVQTRNSWADKLQKSPFLQIIIAALLGISPGCLGAFTVVSLYTHRMMGLAGLVTVMIATSGDEAFVMFALFPGKALIITLLLMVIAIAAGWIVHLFTRGRVIASPGGFIIHDHESCRCFVKEAIIPQIRKITFERIVLLFITILFTVFLVTGMIGPGKWDWKQVTFLICSLFLLFIFINVAEKNTVVFFNQIITRT